MEHDSSQCYVDHALLGKMGYFNEIVTWHVQLNLNPKDHIMCQIDDFDTKYDVYDTSEMTNEQHQKKTLLPTGLDGS